MLHIFAWWFQQRKKAKTISDHVLYEGTRHAINSVRQPTQIHYSRPILPHGDADLVIINNDNCGIFLMSCSERQREIISTARAALLV